MALMHHLHQHFYLAFHCLRSASAGRKPALRYRDCAECRSGFGSFLAEPLFGWACPSRGLRRRRRRRCRTRTRAALRAVPAVDDGRGAPTVWTRPGRPVDGPRRPPTARPCLPPTSPTAGPWWGCGGPQETAPPPRIEIAAEAEEPAPWTGAERRPPQADGRSQGGRRVGALSRA